MIHLLHGQDTYSLHAHLDGLREAVGMPDTRDANITRLAANEVDPAALGAMCQAMPFLAERRLIIVDGLLASLTGEGRGRGRGNQRAAEWTGRFTALAQETAPTTDLVFVEGTVRTTNQLWRELAAVAEVREFAPLNADGLRAWVNEQVARRNGAIAPPAVQRLTDLVGPDLWAMEGEVEKLTLYATGRPINADDVDALVVSAREVSVFAVVDSVLEGRHEAALGSLTRMLEGDATVSYLLAMLARQVRLLLLAQDMLARRTPQAELGGRLGLTSSYPLRKTLEQARRFSPQAARRLHSGLLDTDIAIKSGMLPERIAMERLVAEMCLGAQRQATRPA